MSFRDFVKDLSEHTGSLTDGGTKRRLADERERSYAEVLEALGVVRISGNEVGIADRTISSAFLKSLAFSLERNHPPFGDPAVETSPPLAQALRAMEELRLEAFPTESETFRRERVEQLLIVGAFGDQRFVLLGVDLLPKMGWSVFKPVGVRAGFRTADFRKELTESLGPDTKGISFAAKAIEIEAKQISATRGAYTEYLVFVHRAVRVPRKTQFAYRSSRKLVWLSMEDLEWGLRVTPEAFFPKVFQNRKVLAYLRSPEAIYRMEPRDLEGRCVRRKSIEVLSVSTTHEEGQLRRAAGLITGGGL